MAKIRIGIDGFNLAMPHGTGVATYGFALAETLRSMDVAVEGVFGIPVGARPELREILFYETFGRGIVTGENRYVRMVKRYLAGFRRPKIFDVPSTDLVERESFARRLPHFDRIVSGGRLFEWADRNFMRTGRFHTITVPNPPKIMHWTYPMPLRMAGAKNVYTLHDLVPLKLPYATLDRKRAYFRTIERIVRDADHICTVSESSRNDIIRQFAVAEDRITNTYQSAPIPLDVLQSSDRNAGDAASIFGLSPRGYFLYFGAIEPKKNVGRLIEAYLAAQVDTPLVIVGARAWQSEESLQLLTSGLAAAAGEFGRRVARQVVRLDYLPRALLLRLVANARAVVFPSLYEGFGLPVLEAMQLGTPVITSDRSSIPEVAGDAAMLVDPYDSAAIARAIVTMDRESGLRDDLARRGLMQAALFSSERYRERLQTMYAGVMAARS